ncbi:MAG: hypothetical protein K0S28_1906 [Paucimonas sp.]|nr:hypothetical protein [Paucimonas sp.]
MLGCTIEQLLDRPVADFTHPDDIRASESALKKVIDEKVKITLDKRYCRADGSVVWTRHSLTCIDDCDSNFPCVLAVTVDLTDRRYEEEALRASEERYRTLFESIDEGFCVMQLLRDDGQSVWDGCFVEINPAFERHSGLQNALGKRMRELTPDISDSWFDVYVGVVATGHSVRFESYVKALERWFTVNTFRVGKPEDHRVAILFSDITEQKAVQTELFVINERLKLAVEGSGDGIWDWNIKTNAVDFSTRWCEMLGYEEGEISTIEAWRRLVHPDDLARVLLDLQACLDGKSRSYSCEHRMKVKGSGWKWVLARGIVVARDGHRKPLRMTGTLTDIAERKQADELIWKHANFDILTGLPNRRLFRDRLDQEVRKAERTGNRLGLLFIDLDRFKEVNDLLGHDAGDLLLQQASQRLQRCVRKSDTVARLGGDEFTVILTELESLVHVEQVCTKILDALASPFCIAGETAYLSGSIGITIHPQDARTSDELIRKADQAMYAAKSAGKNRFSYFTAAMDEQARLKIKMAGELRVALASGQLEVYYQPVIHLAQRRIVKAEALLRWHHPTFGVIEPARFIPLAEDSGLIDEIGEWVFSQAVGCSKRWGGRLGVPFQIGVNKSPAQFLLQAGPEKWMHEVEQLELPRRSISVEITEGMLLHASPKVTSKLLEYRDAGIQVAIDDFGTGYSSMAYLKKFDINYLKIDQSFVTDIMTDDGNRTIAESIIAMAHKLGLEVIAEGIETQEQEDILIAAGCDYGQGYLFSEALPSDSFEHLLISGGGTWKQAAQNGTGNSAGRL